MFLCALAALATLKTLINRKEIIKTSYSTLSSSSLEDCETCRNVQLTKTNNIQAQSIIIIAKSVRRSSYPRNGNGSITIINIRCLNNLITFSRRKLIDN